MVEAEPVNCTTIFPGLCCYSLCVSFCSIANYSVTHSHAPSALLWLTPSLTYLHYSYSRLFLKSDFSCFLLRSLFILAARWVWRELNLLWLFIQSHITHRDRLCSVKCVRFNIFLSRSLLGFYFASSWFMYSGEHITSRNWHSRCQFSRFRTSQRKWKWFLFTHEASRFGELAMTKFLSEPQS